MRTLSFLFVFVVSFTILACNNSSQTASKTFCDTAACKTDSLVFKGDNKLHQVVAIGLNACKADSLFWTHDFVGSKQLSLQEDLGQDVSLNPSAVDCYFKDTIYAWLQFNDCKTGRGFLYKLPFSKSVERRKITAALTKFDPKFSVDPDLIAYTDRGSVFVENKETGKQAILPFDKPYDIDFNKPHEMIDSIHVTKDRVFVQMIRDGAKKTYEKQISL